MGIKIGADVIQALYIGEQKIVKAYAGEELVFGAKKPDADLAWNLASMPQTSNWDGIVRGTDKFVAGTTSSVYAGAYSLDGVTWLPTSYSAKGQYTKFAQGNGKYLALSPTASKGIYSPDGISFTGITVNITLVYGVAYGNGVFVAVIYSASSNAVYYSSDGTTWKTAKLPASGNNSYKYNVYFLNDRFFAIGNSVLLYSYDGITWYSCSGAPSIGNAYAMAFNGDVYVAVGATGQNMYSRDGVTWTANRSITSPEGTPNWRYLAYGAGMFVLLGQTCNYAMCSTDGLTWNSVKLPEGASTFRGLAYGAGRFVAPIYNSNKILYSNLLEAA